MSSLQSCAHGSKALADRPEHDQLSADLHMWQHDTGEQTGAVPSQAELPELKHCDHMLSATAHGPDATAQKCREQAVLVGGQEGEGLVDQNGVLGSESAGIQKLPS